VDVVPHGEVVLHFTKSRTVDDVDGVLLTFNDALPQSGEDLCKRHACRVGAECSECVDKQCDRGNPNLEVFEICGTRYLHPVCGELTEAGFTKTEKLNPVFCCERTVCFSARSARHRIS